MKWNDFEALKTPFFLIDCDELLLHMERFQKRCSLLNIKPLLSIKGFPLASVFGLISPFLSGVSAASPFEALLGKRLGKEVHIHAPAYKEEDFNSISKCCDHIVFNSLNQWKQYQGKIGTTNNSISCGLRINPEFSEIEIEKYNPCLPYSRFGVTVDKLLHENINGIEGFHMHVMCDQGANTLVRVIEAVTQKFGDYFPQLRWINLGGGHQLSSPEYKSELLIKPMLALTSNLDVYVEPCESIVTSSGYLVSTVMDIVDNGKKTVILDTSAICHMPDVLDMPYRPDLVYPSDLPNGTYRYLFAGISCLPGDIIGEYSFDHPLSIGEKVVFSDMGAYTFAKESYFNGINFPSIVLYSKHDGLRIVKSFGYKDYESQYL